MGEGECLLSPSEVENCFMEMSLAPTGELPPTSALDPPLAPTASVILSFDVEEHYRIEAAAHLFVGDDYRQQCSRRLDESTRWLLHRLGEQGIQATFFIVGQIARHNPDLVRAISRAGHEVASHGWNHQRIGQLTPKAFRQDVRQSKDALEQVSGLAIAGYRAPTFSVTRQTAWALDVLVEEGFQYDSSIYPVRHDRYGVPDAPRLPFLVRGRRHSILELPPATLRILGVNVPMGGGGYFRLFPLFLTRWAIQQTLTGTTTPVAMLYFHPWEFDLEQEHLPLGWLSRWRTYVGIGRTRARLADLLGRYPFTRAADVARQIDPQTLGLFSLDEGLEQGVIPREHETALGAATVNRS
jgi:polysaccharide deacetylase family protein (PEP-CTERM system associated)